MGKGNRNRRLTLQNEAEDRYNHPEKYRKNAKHSGKGGFRGKDGSQIPAWAAILAFALVAVIVVGAASITFINNNGVALRANTALESENYEINGTMMKYLYYMQYQNTYATYYNYAVNYLGNANYMSYFGWTINENFDHADEKNNTCSLGTVKKDEDGKEMKDENGNKIYESEAMALRGGNVYTWWDYFMDLALDQAEEILVYCEAAYAEGYTSLEALNPDAKAEINETLADLKKAASSAGFSMKGYLSQLYGSGVTEKDVRAALELTYIAAEYAELKELEFKGAIKNEDVDKQYTENELEYLFSDVVFFQYSLSFDEILEQEVQALGEEYEDSEYEEALKKAEEQYVTCLEHLRKTAPKFAEAKGNEELFRKLILEVYGYKYYFDRYDEVLDGSLKGDPTEKIESIEKVVADAIALALEAKEPITVDTKKDPLAKRIASLLYTENEALLYEDMPYSDNDAGKWAFKAIAQEKGNVLVVLKETDGTESIFEYPTLEYPEEDEKEEDKKEEADKDEADKEEDKKDEEEDSKDDKKESQYQGQLYGIDAYYMVDTAARDEYNTVDFGFIIVEDTGDHDHKEGEEVDHEHVDAKFQAEDYLTRFKAGGVLTPEAFEKFAEDNDIVNFNVLESYLKGEFGYPEIDEWLYGDENRVGSGAVVPVYADNTDPLYYVVVYCFAESDPAWFVDAKNDILEAKVEAWDAEITETYESTFKTNVSTLKKIG